MYLYVQEKPLFSLFKFKNTHFHNTTSLTREKIHIHIENNASRDESNPKKERRKKKIITYQLQGPSKEFILQYLETSPPSPLKHQVTTVVYDREYYVYHMLSLFFIYHII